MNMINKEPERHELEADRRPPPELLQDVEQRVVLSGRQRELQDVAGAVACELAGCGGRSAGRLARCRKPAHLRPWDARRLDSSRPCRPYLASRDAARRTSSREACRFGPFS